MAESSDEPRVLDSNDGDAESDAVCPPEPLFIQRLRRREKNWELYGEYIVCCKGAIYIGPVRSWWWLLELLTIIVTTTFIVEYQKYHLGVFVTGLVLAAACLISSARVLLSNPGIIPRKPYAESLALALEVAETMRRVSNPRRLLEWKGEMVYHSYCFRCHIFRPPKTTHCSTCDACTVEVDHHCPVFGGCVTKKNLVWFHIMAFTMAFYYPYMLITSIIAGFQDYEKHKTHVLLASMVANETIVGIFLALTLTPLLTLTPCEQERDHPHLYNADAHPPRFPGGPNGNLTHYPVLRKRDADKFSKLSPLEIYQRTEDRVNKNEDSTVSIV